MRYRVHLKMVRYMFTDIEAESKESAAAQALKEDKSSFKVEYTDQFSVKNIEERDPKREFLRNNSEFQQRRLMESAIVINNIYRKMEECNTINSGNFNGDIMEVITDLAREFEYTFFETDEYEDDYVGLLEKWAPKRLKEEVE